MVCLTRDQILGAAFEVKRVAITVKAWGGTFYVQEWSAAEYDAWEQAVVANRKNLRAITVAHGLFTESGERVFSDDDAEALGGKRGISRDLDRIAKRVRELNRLDAEDFEEEQGNSEPDRSASSASS
jgi:hypothetical protein